MYSFVRSASALKNRLKSSAFIQSHPHYSHQRVNFHASQLSETTGTESSENKSITRRKKSNDKKSKDKRREFIGKAKAVDRGQWAAVYSPGGLDCMTFEAKSGLPDRSKPFTALGIESSCDDTGGEFELESKIIASFYQNNPQMTNWTHVFDEYICSSCGKK